MLLQGEIQQIKATNAGGNATPIINCWFPGIKKALPQLEMLPLLLYSIYWQRTVNVSQIRSPYRSHPLLSDQI